MPALYLALSAVGAVKEANQGFAHKIDPCTLCSYDVDCEDIADLSDTKLLVKLGIAPAELACPWATIAAGGGDPPSWKIARQLKAEGYAGLIVPSFAKAAAPDERNLVLWTWAKILPHRVTVNDPSGKLPKNQLSWD